MLIPRALSPALVESVRGNADAALRALAVAEERTSVCCGGWLSRLAYEYSRIGHGDEAVRLLNELEGLSDETSRVSPGHLALAHLTAGNYEESLGWHDAFIENADRPKGGTGLWPHIKADDFLTPFSNDPSS